MPPSFKHATLEVREQRAAPRRGYRVLFVAFAIFGLLWVLYLPWRAIYVLNDFDIPALADGLLLADGARWQDWFTRGYSHFWNLYPDWPGRGMELTSTDFTRPAFQFVIYLAHFVLGRDWASYQLINCFAVAGVGAVTFQIAQAALDLRTGPSLVAVMLVVLSPPVLQSWLFGVAFAIEPVATVLVASAFLAVLARRDLLCLTLLFLALLTKENTVWAFPAAAITIILRPKLNESLRRRAIAAAAMFIPVTLWLGFRFAFFGGVGGTYATSGYTPLAEFLEVSFYKFTHVDHLFLTHWWSERGMGLLILNRGTAVVVYGLLLLWALRFAPEAISHFRYALHQRRWPTVGNCFLVTLWALIALMFHFAVPLSDERYATSIVVFAWPALVAQVEQRGKVFWLGLAVCCIAAVIQSSYLLVDWVAKPDRKDYRANVRRMNALLRQVPVGTKKIYVLSAGSLQATNPKYVGLVLGLSAEIVRIIEIDWKCEKESDWVGFDHSTANGLVSLTVTLPACATFLLNSNRFDGISNGHLYRNNTLSYQLPEATPIMRTKWWQPGFNLGRRMTVHVRLNGPARFIIEHGGPNGFAWFDVPDTATGGHRQ